MPLLVPPGIISLPLRADSNLAVEGDPWPGFIVDARLEVLGIKPLAVRGPPSMDSPFDPRAVAIPDSRRVVNSARLVRRLWESCGEVAWDVRAVCGRLELVGTRLRIPDDFPSEAPITC
mmetsp:Transcript_25691/g.33654  ORF Transcript_25691/g.33654 Transcript_25691/m.33654 type:complete len:119 (+) Transcript_25691:2-358(+)